MKINSNTVSLTKESEDFKALEEVIKKVASENGIEAVESIEISLSPEEGLIGFKTSCEGNPEDDDKDDEE